jgi:hypothetical protein
MIDEVLGSLGKHLPSKIAAPIVVSIDCATDFGNEDQRRVKGEICKQLLIAVEGNATGLNPSKVSKQHDRIKKMATRQTDDQPMMCVYHLLLSCYQYNLTNLFSFLVLDNFDFMTGASVTTAFLYGLVKLLNSRLVVICAGTLDVKHLGLDNLEARLNYTHFSVTEVCKDEDKVAIITLSKYTETQLSELIQARVEGTMVLENVGVANHIAEIVELRSKENSKDFASGIELAFALLRGLVNKVQWKVNQTDATDSLITSELTYKYVYDVLEFVQPEGTTTTTTSTTTTTETPISPSKRFAYVQLIGQNGKRKWIKRISSKSRRVKRRCMAAPKG